MTVGLDFVGRIHVSAGWLGTMEEVLNSVNITNDDLPTERKEDLNGINM